MSENTDKRSSRFWGNVIYCCCRAVGLLPWWFLYYVLAEPIYFLLYYVVRYRVKVTRSNLRNSFPEKGKKELRRIERAYYRHLSQVFIDTIDLAGISPKAMLRRMVMVDEEKIRGEMLGRDFIGAMSHYGSWEYFMFFAINAEQGRRTLGVYKPLHNKAFDHYYRKMRSRLGMIPVSMRMVTRDIVTNKRAGNSVTLGIVGDQTPRRSSIDHWFDFLGQPTPFYSGIEKLALKFGMAVYFLDIEKVKRAHYVVRPVMIWDGREEVSQWEITERYIGKLEEMIRRNPQYWMWSHRRWKSKPEAGELEVGEPTENDAED